MSSKATQKTSRITETRQDGSKPEDMVPPQECTPIAPPMVPLVLAMIVVVTNTANYRLSLWKWKAAQLEFQIIEAPAA